MAFAASGLSLDTQLIGGVFRKWTYRTTDAIATVTATDYIADASTYGLGEGDIVVVQKTDANPPTNYVCVIDAIDADDNATLKRSTLPLTDNSTGTASTTLAAGVGVTTLAFFFNLAEIAGNGDVLTTYTPGYKFKILSVDFAVCKAVTTAAKRADLNIEIGTTDLTGGVVSITSAAATPAGVVIAGSAVTAANTGSSSATISVEASNVTAHAEGSGWLLVKIQNMDTADAVASLAVQG